MWILLPGADIEQTIELKKKTYSYYFESMYNNQLINYKNAHSLTDTMTKCPVKYVIVADSSFHHRFSHLCSGRQRKDLL